MKCHNTKLCYMHTEATDTGCKILSLDMPHLCEARKAFNRLKKARQEGHIRFYWDKVHKK